MRALRRSVALAALITGAWALQVSPVFAFTGTNGAGGGNQRNGARPRHPWGQRNELRSGAGGSADENLHLLSHAAQRVSARFEWPGWRLGSPAAYNYLPLWNHTLEADTVFKMYD